MNARIETLSATLMRLAQPGMRPKDLLKAVRETHPQATRKEVVRAAFYTVIANADAEPQATAVLHDFALAERIGGGNEAA